MNRAIPNIYCMHTVEMRKGERSGEENSVRKSKRKKMRYRPFQIRKSLARLIFFKYIIGANPETKDCKESPKSQ